jgi:hypothetical protein
VYPGPIDTDMTKWFDIAKDSPEHVWKNIIQGIEDWTEDIFPDTMSGQMGPKYLSSPKTVEQMFATF